eukprot:COSAG02_NODE_8287_length_2631_cov_25.944322_3_plen_274_part_00
MNVLFQPTDAAAGSGSSRSSNLEAAAASVGCRDAELGTGAADAGGSSSGWPVPAAWSRAACAANSSRSTSSYSPATSPSRALCSPTMYERYREPSLSLRRDGYCTPCSPEVPALAPKLSDEAPCERGVCIVPLRLGAPVRGDAVLSFDAARWLASVGDDSAFSVPVVEDRANGDWLICESSCELSCFSRALRDASRREPCTAASIRFPLASDVEDDATDSRRPPPAGGTCAHSALAIAVLRAAGSTGTARRCTGAAAGWSHGSNGSWTHAADG